MKKILFAAAALLLSMSPRAYAEEPEYQKKTVIDFEEVLLEGELKKPAGDYITERQSRKFNSMIKVRKNFEQEMFRSVENLN